MDGTFRGLTLIESELFTWQLEEIASHRYVDEALIGFWSAVCTNPEAFPIVPGRRELRLAKTGAYTRDGIEVPPLRLWFRILDENSVELLSVEPIMTY